MGDWEQHVQREERRYRDGESRLPGPEDPDGRQRQLTRIANVAYGAGLAEIMRGDSSAARAWLERAAARYRESLEGAPPDSWGRYVGAMKSLVLAGDSSGAEAEARRTIAAAGDPSALSPIGQYAACLAHLVLGEDGEARLLADELRIHDGFSTDVADALAMIAAGTDRPGYVQAVEEVLESFERREKYLEDVPVADTVIVLQVLAARRDLAAELESPLLPR